MLLLLWCTACVLFALWTWRMRTHTAPRAPPYYTGVYPIIGHAQQLIGNTESATWKRHRQLISPAFSTPVLHGFLGIFNSQSRILVRNLSSEVGKGRFNVTAFGVEVLHDEEFIKKYTEGLRHRLLLDLLLELSNNNTLPDEEIRDEVNTFIVADYDTTSVTIAYVLMNLGTYPEVQDRVYEEVQSVVGDSDRDLKKADLPQLTYLEAVIKESLRLYPVAPALLRHADKDVQLKKYTIPAGAEVLLLMYGQNRHAIWGVNANKFRPERWLQPHPAHHSAFGSFSMGKRHCLGQAYALMSMKTTLVHVIRNYKVTADIRELRLKLDFLAKPVEGSNIALERRN